MTLGAQLGALEAETESLVMLLQRLGPEAWSLPTRCPPLDVRELAAHVLVSYRTLERVAHEASLGGDVEQDWITWWQYDREEVGPWVLRLAADQAETLPYEDAARALATEARRAVSAAAARLSSEDPVCRPFFGTVRLSDFVVTRVVEVCVHSLDLRHALELRPWASSDGLRVTANTPRPARLGPTRRDG